MNKRKSLIFAPLPPPVGGIASITAMLYKGMADNEDVLFENPIIKNNKKNIHIIRVITNIKILFSSTLRVVKGGSVLFFSSAYASFWEKLLWSRLVIALGRKPVIVMVDGNFPRFYQSLSKSKRKLVQWLIANNNLIIGAQSESWGEYYKGIFPNNTIRPISASVDEVFFLKQSKIKPLSASLNILYVGWIIEDKGILDLLNAIELIKDQVMGAKFKLLGTLFGREEFWLEETNKRGINDIVNFAGPLNSRQAILEEYASADIFIFPSHYEGFPVALLEAIAVGLPCIGTKIGGIPDILDHGNAGLVINPHCPNELADSILKLISDINLRNSYSIAAAKRAKTKYTFAKLIDSYKEILDLNGS